MQHINGHVALENQAVLQQQHVDAKIVDALIKKGAGSASADWTPCKHRTGAAKAHDWACGRLAACFRSTGTKVKTQRAVTAVDGNKRGDLELVAYICNGAQDLVLDLSFRHYRAGAAPRNWHRNGELLHPGNPDKESTTSCCDCCFCMRTGRRHASLRFSTTGTRNHTPLGLPTAALLSSTLSCAPHFHIPVI